MFHFFVYVGTVDDSKIQVRPANESWMENPFTIITFKHAGNRGINFIKTKSLAFLNIAIFLRHYDFNAGKYKTGCSGIF